MQLCKNRVEISNSRPEFLLSPISVQFWGEIGGNASPSSEMRNNGQWLLPQDGPAFATPGNTAGTRGKYARALGKDPSFRQERWQIRNLHLNGVFPSVIRGLERGPVHLVAEARLRHLLAAPADYPPSCRLPNTPPQPPPPHSHRLPRQSFKLCQNFQVFFPLSCLQRWRRRGGGAEEWVEELRLERWGGGTSHCADCETIGPQHNHSYSIEKKSESYSTTMAPLRTGNLRDIKLLLAKHDSKCFKSNFLFIRNSQFTSNLEVNKLHNSLQCIAKYNLITFLEYIFTNTLFER